MKLCNHQPMWQVSAVRSSNLSRCADHKQRPKLIVIDAIPLITKHGDLMPLPTSIDPASPATLQGRSGLQAEPLRHLPEGVQFRSLGERWSSSVNRHRPVEGGTRVEKMKQAIDDYGTTFARAISARDPARLGSLRMWRC